MPPPMLERLLLVSCGHSLLNKADPRCDVGVNEWLCTSPTHASHCYPARTDLAQQGNAPTRFALQPIATEPSRWTVAAAHLSSGEPSGVSLHGARRPAPNPLEARHRDVGAPSG